MAAAAAATPYNGRKVAIVGSGLVGRSWAMIFASAGCKVGIHSELAIRDCVIVDKLAIRNFSVLTIFHTQSRDSQ